MGEAQFNWNGPLLSWDGSIRWFRNGLLHREDVPAIESSNGCKEWYLNGDKYTQEELVLLQFTKGIIINE